MQNPRDSLLRSTVGYPLGDAVHALEGATIDRCLVTLGIDASTISTAAFGSRFQFTNHVAFLLTAEALDRIMHHKTCNTTSANTNREKVMQILLHHMLEF